MGSPRLIPVVSLIGESAVKTQIFSNPKYVGDPANTVALFDSFEVEELIVLDISKSFNKASTSKSTLSRIVENAYMPISYGGGIQNLDEASSYFDLGFDKLVIRSQLFNSNLILGIAQKYGSQAVTGCLDVIWSEKNFHELEINGEKITIEEIPSYLNRIHDLGLGELIIQDVNADGLRIGLRSNPLLETAISRLEIPIVALGGCRNFEDAAKFIDETGCHSVAASTTFLFRPTREAVLVNFPSIEAWQAVLRRI